MDLSNQAAYWNSVASTKQFTHPIDFGWLYKFIDKTAVIIDYGCGYGRLVSELRGVGFNNVSGFDTSIELVNRGKDLGNIFHIESSDRIPIADNSANCILLFAVLTCIPANTDQIGLIETLWNKLAPGGILYISDYYLQTDTSEVGRYEHLNGDENNYGVFTLREGATFRHHTREWISKLLSRFKIEEERVVPVKTMNGNEAIAFQIIAQKSKYFTG